MHKKEIWCPKLSNWVNSGRRTSLHERLHVHFFCPLPQRTSHNNRSHPVVKTIIMPTAGKIIRDGAAAGKSPETLRIFHFPLSQASHRDKNPGMKDWIKHRHLHPFKLHLWMSSLSSFFFLPPKPNSVWTLQQQQAGNTDESLLACCKQFVTFRFASCQTRLR